MSYFDDQEEMAHTRFMRSAPRWKWKGRFHILHPEASRDPRYPNEDMRYAKRQTLCGVEVDLLDRIRNPKKATCKACLRVRSAPMRDEMTEAVPRLTPGSET